MNGPLSVKEVVDNAHKLNSRTVTVRGWIQYCHRLSCPLFQSAEEVGKEWPRYFLSIGSSSWFDSAVQPRVPGLLTLRVRVNDDCISNPRTGVIAVCADRSNSLEVLSVIR